MTIPLRMLKERAKSTTQTALAKEIGISVQYLNDILNGRRQPGESVLAALGLEKVITYRKVRQ